MNFEFDVFTPEGSWDRKLRRLMAYFEEDTQLRDILITGGDALMSQNKNASEYSGCGVSDGGTQTKGES